MCEFELKGIEAYIRYLKRIAHYAKKTIIEVNKYELSRQTAIEYSVDNTSLEVLRRLEEEDNTYGID